MQPSAERACPNRMTMEMPLRGLLALALTLPVAGAGCQTPATITYSFTPATPAVSAVDAKPRLDLGESGDASEVFNRIVAVRQDGAGRIIVAMRSPAELRVFDKTGRFVRTIGRNGQGPGEFQDITDVIVRPHDSLFVVDMRQRRFTSLGPDGSVASTSPLKPPFTSSPFSTSISSLDDGSVLIGYGFVSGLKPSKVPVSVPQIVGRYSSTGARLDSLGSFFFSEHFYQVTPPELGGFAFWDRAFGRRGRILGTGNSFMTGDASAMEVRRFSPTGKLLEIHRIDAPAKNLTASQIEQYKQNEMEVAKPRERPVEQKRVDEMPYPAALPAYHQFLVDGRGRIWLHEYSYPAVMPPRWIVMDPKTRSARTVSLPARFKPFEITSTEILGVWLDTDDVEHVRAYRLLN